MVTPQLSEPELQFQVVAKVALQTRKRPGTTLPPRNVGMKRIGMQIFGLTEKQASQCIGRAHHFLELISRGRGLTSDDLLAARELWGLAA